MSIVGNLARAWFTVTLLFILSLWVVGSACTRVLYCAGLLRYRTQGDLSIAIGTLCSRLLFTLCPHVHVRHIPEQSTPLERWQTLLAASRDQAPMLLLNHTSFLDLFVMCATVGPYVVVRTHMRCILAAKLTQLPLLGNALGVWSGNFPAHFKDTAGGISGSAGSSFATDREKQSVVTADVTAHVSSGGMLAVCPEGTVNANPRMLLPFRHGAFRIAIEHQMPIFAIVTAGCDSCWPKHAALGGTASTVYVGDPVYLLTPERGADSVAVAEECRRLMQEMADALRDLPQDSGGGCRAV